MATKINEFSWKVSRPYGRIYTRNEGAAEWLDGTVVTAHGIVDVYSQGGSASYPFSTITFVCDGRCYTRNSKQRLTKRGLVTAADRFAREIVDQQEGA